MGTGNANFFDRLRALPGEKAVLQFSRYGGIVLMGPRIRILPTLQERSVFDGEIDR